MSMLAADHELLGIVPRRAATLAGPAASSRCGAAPAVPTFQQSRSVAGRVVLLDDDTALLAEPLRRILAAPGGQVHVLSSGPTTIDRICALAPDAVVLELSELGLETFRQIRRVNAWASVVFVTGPTRAEDAVEAMKLGAHEILPRPVNIFVLQRVIAEALEVAQRMREADFVGNAGGPEIREDDQALIGSCPAMLEVYKSIGRVAAQNIPVLITGESGTGKELVARAIHRHSDRSEKPFLAINCAAIPESLLESELFGVEKGAFTGADRRRIGKFERCSGGTILLDEIGDMPLATQAKVLRLLQDQTFERVGGNETIRTDVRIIAATNRNLKLWSEQVHFRADLYYRLSVFSIHLPPLRDRGDDLPMLVDHYLRQSSRQLNRDVRWASPDALERLHDYAWPGNVRELQSVIKQALLNAKGGVLIPSFLPNLAAQEVSETQMPQAPPTDGWGTLDAFVRQRFQAGSNQLSGEAQRELDRVLLPAVLEFTDCNQTRAAQVLGISRHTLRQRLRRIGFAFAPRIDIDAS